MFLFETGPFFETDPFQIITDYQLRLLRGGGGLGIFHIYRSLFFIPGRQITYLE